VRRSSERILTTHVGALPVPDDVWGEHAVEAAIARGVTDVVTNQFGAGVDVVNEGELTKGGNWVVYVNSRLSGFEAEATGATAGIFMHGKDWETFGEFYQAALEAGTLFEQTKSAPDSTRSARSDWVCTGPIEYSGAAALEREIGLLKDALGDREPGDAFLTSTAPASIEVGRLNRYYKSDEEYVFALADALKVEYETIVAAGFNVQVDDAWLPALWDRIGIEMGWEAYRRYCMMRVEALNHALSGVPEEKVRYHLCWGSWHGPHAFDVPMSDMADIMLSVNAQMYLFEAANARHEHEYVIWEDKKLPDGKILAPGVVSHATTLIEHPELVSQRVQRFANLVGRENVIASTDCGLGLRCHPQIAWAKLKALSDGAALASAALDY
jgi:5-methyltetrahydropteroyltriglutamate--homocysteine methyltransferase